MNLYEQLTFKRSRANIEPFAEIIRYSEDGLYFIDEVYVGKAFDLLNRFWGHVESPLPDRGHNDNLSRYIKNKFLNNEKITIRQICNDVTKENDFIYEYSKYYDLFNRTGVAPKEVILAARARRNKLIEQAEKMIEEMYGQVDDKQRNDLHNEYLKQMFSKMLYLLNINVVNDHVVKQQFEVFNGLKPFIHELQMNGQPIALSPDFLELKKGEVVERIGNKLKTERDTGKENKTFSR